VALLLLILQTVVFIAGLALLGQFMVGLFHWGRRRENPVYQLFGIVARPLVRAVRAVTPRIVLDDHVPIVAFLLCAILYFALGFAHRGVCLSDLGQDGCTKWVQARISR
jgi:uncharacterized protein YggT (Ycf19 family)